MFSHIKLSAKDVRKPTPFFSDPISEIKRLKYVATPSSSEKLETPLIFLILSDFKYFYVFIYSLFIPFKDP